MPKQFKVHNCLEFELKCVPVMAVMAPTTEWFDGLKKNYLLFAYFWSFCYI